MHRLVSLRYLNITLTGSKSKLIVYEYHRYKPLVAQHTLTMCIPEIAFLFPSSKFGEQILNQISALSRARKVLKTTEQNEENPKKQTMRASTSPEEEWNSNQKRQEHPKNWRQQDRQSTFTNHVAQRQRQQHFHLDSFLPPRSISSPPPRVARGTHRHHGRWRSRWCHPNPFKINI